MVTDRLFVGNPRRPFEEIEILDYDMESDDLENPGEKLDDMESSVSEDSDSNQTIFANDEKPSIKPEVSRWQNLFDPT